MKRASRWVLLAVSAWFVAGPVAAQTADEIVEKHLAALGGREALQKATSQVTTGTISIAMMGNEIAGPMEIYHKAPNKVRTWFKLDLSAMGAGEMVIDQRCDGKTAWAGNSLQGDKEITGNQLQSLLNATFPTPLLDYKGAGAKVELAGKEKVDGRDAYVLVFTPKAGSASRQFIDAETFLMVKNVAKVDVPEMGGEIEQVTQLGDYRPVAGLKVPYSVKITNSAQTIALTVSKVEANVPIDEALFSKPVAK